MDNILLLKLKSPYDYIQEGHFLGQMARLKVFLFKMSFHGPTSRVDLVKHMQPGEDLPDC
jgi:hypothetical protein